MNGEGLLSRSLGDHNIAYKRIVQSANSFVLNQCERIIDILSGGDWLMSFDLAFESRGNPILGKLC